jgi:hypothetical protein
MPEKCHVSQFPGFKIYLIFHNSYYKRKCFKSIGVPILNSYKILPIEENSKWRNCVVTGDEHYDLLACGAVYSVRNLPMYCLKMVVLHSFRMLMRWYSVTFQKTAVITFTKMYSCCYKCMQTLFFILNTVTPLTMHVWLYTVKNIYNIWVKIFAKSWQI